MAELPQNVRLQLAELASVPHTEREEFCHIIQLPVRLAWEFDTGANGNNASAALVRAAGAARSLLEALDGLSASDRTSVEQLWTKTPQFQRFVPSLQHTVPSIAHLLGTAVGKAVPLASAGTHKRGRRTGDVKDMAFRELVRLLLVVTVEWCGGKLSFDKNYPDRSTLITALEAIRPHVPAGAMPKDLPLSTIQRIRTGTKLYMGYPDIDLFIVG